MRALAFRSGGVSGGDGGMSAAAENAIIGLPQVVKSVVSGESAKMLAESAKVLAAVEAVTMQLAALGADADPRAAMEKITTVLLAVAENGETEAGKVGALDLPSASAMVESVLQAHSLG